MYLDSLQFFLNKPYEPDFDYYKVISKSKKILYDLIDSNQKSIIDFRWSAVKDYCSNINEIYYYIKNQYSSFSKNSKSREQTFIDLYKNYHYVYLEKQFWDFYNGVVSGKFTKIEECNIKQCN